MSACAGRVKDRYAGKHFHDGSVELQIPPLRYPGFPVDLGGVGAIHAPFFTEGRTRGLVQCSVAGNPGTLRSVTKGRVTLPFRFDSLDDEQQVPPLRYAPVGMTLLFG
jgi:hypothetical protein